MTNTKKQALAIYKEEGLQALCDWLYENDLHDNLCTENYFKERMQEELNNDVPDYNLINHFAEALQDFNETGYYIYDWSMGTLETPTPVNDIEDLDLDNYLE